MSRAPLSLREMLHNNRRGSRFRVMTFTRVLPRLIIALNEAYCDCIQSGDLRDITRHLYYFFFLAVPLQMINYWHCTISYYCHVKTIGKGSQFSSWNYLYFPIFSPSVLALWMSVTQNTFYHKINRTIFSTMKTIKSY